MKPKECKELVELATGAPILGYTEEEVLRKKRFLAFALKAVKSLAERLDAPKGGARINPAGPAVSGEAYLSAPSWEIHLSQSTPRNNWGDFYLRRGRDRETVWVKWEALLAFDGLVGRLRKEPHLADRPPEKAQPLQPTQKKTG